MGLQGSQDTLTVGDIPTTVPAAGGVALRNAAMRHDPLPPSSGALSKPCLRIR